MENCLFCKIIKHEIPANIIAANDKVTAFHDINPIAPVHILIVPNRHIPGTLALDQGNISVLEDIAMLAKEISAAESIDLKGFRWVINTGLDGGQSVDHLHMHLIGGRQLNWPPG